jgi:hypothetical protein
MMSTFQLPSSPTGGHSTFSSVQQGSGAFLSPKSSNVIFKKTKDLSVTTLLSLNGHLASTGNSHSSSAAMNPFEGQAEPAPDIAFFSGQLDSTYKHLFIKMYDKANYFEQAIENYGALAFDSLQNISFPENNNNGNTAAMDDDPTACIPINEWRHPGFPSESTVCTFGKLWADSDEGKWHERSVLLETSRRLGSGAKVRLNLSQLSSFSFFPGQLVALAGLPSLDAFHVKQLLPVPLLPRPLTKIEHIATSASFTTAQRMIVASGPFVFYDKELKTLDFSPLEKLLAYAASRSTHCALLIGPFLDADTLASYYKEAAEDDTMLGPEAIFTNHIVTRLNHFVSQHHKCTLIFMILSIHKDLCIGSLSIQPSS